MLNSTKEDASAKKSLIKNKIVVESKKEKINFIETIMLFVFDSEKTFKPSNKITIIKIITKKRKFNLNVSKINTFI